MADYKYVDLSTSASGYGTVEYPYGYIDWFNYVNSGSNGFGVEVDTVFVLSGTRTTTGALEIDINMRYENMSISAVNWQTTPWKITTDNLLKIKTGRNGFTPNLYFSGGILEDAYGFEIVAYDNPQNKILNTNNMWINDRIPSPS